MLKIKIEENFKSALKEKRKAEIATLRMLKAAIFNKEKEKRYKLARQNFEEQNLGGLSQEKLEKESQLCDKEVIEVIFSEIKKRKEAILEFQKGKREDLMKKEKAEMKILQSYLPEQPRAQNNFVLGRAHKICAPIPEKEIKKLAKESIAVLRASLAPEEREKVGLKDMGKVMAELMPKVKGKAEGSLVSKIVKELLAP